MIRTRLAFAAALCLTLPSASFGQSARDYLPREPGLRPDPAREVRPPEETAPPAAIRPAASTGGLLLRGIALDGATAVSEAELAPLWAGLIGSRVGVPELEAVAAAIGAAYRARGYILSQAVLPAQDASGGIVRIRVVEGFVETVEVLAENSSVQATTERIFAPVPADRPLRITTLERSVLLARDTFGAEVETVLEPAPVTFGAANLGVSAAVEPTSYFATVDNRGSRLYGAWTLGAGSRSYNLLGLYERIDTLIAVAPSDASMLFAAATLDKPLASLAGSALDGGRLELHADFSRADPDLAKSGSPDGLSLVQDETNLHAGLLVPFIRTRSQNLFGRAGLGFQESRGITDFADVESEQTDRLWVLDARLTWDAADRFGGVTLVDATVRKGLDIGGATVGADGPAAGVPDFLLADLTLSRLQRLGNGGWAIYGEATGQIAADVLPTTERFSLGDSTIGRGFAPGNTSGDSGFGTRLELRREIAPERLRDAVQSAELYVYGDYGRAWDRSLARDGEQVETLASWGFGARIDVRPWLTLTPEVARQLEGTATDTTETGLETRFYIGAIARF